MDKYRRKLFLYIGNMEKRKGVDLLINGYLKYKELGGKRSLFLVERCRRMISILLYTMQWKKIRT